MYAGEFHEACQARIVEIDGPGRAVDAEGPSILFEPELACLCGSDLLYYEGTYPEYPCHVGQSLHEMIGRVVETRGSRFQVGDRVLCVPVEHYGFFQQYYVNESRAVPLDTRASDEQILLSQPLGTVICALKKLPPVMDRDVVVAGQGPMGLLITLTLRNLGARRIITIDENADRIEVSRAVGATDSFHGRAEEAADFVAEATDGTMADLVIEAIGHREQVLNHCIDLCRPFGDILFFGVPPQTIPDLKLKKLFWKNLAVHTSVGPDFQRDFPLAMRWIAERRVDVTPLITHRFDVQHIQQAFELFRMRQDGAIKVLIDMNW